MGGTTEPIIAALNDTYAENASLREAVKIAVDALRVGIASNGSAPGTELRTLDTWRSPSSTPAGRGGPADLGFCAGRASA
jgi:20S proteasome alpha/beta subunit